MSFNDATSSITITSGKYEGTAFRLANYDDQEGDITIQFDSLIIDGHCANAVPEELGELIKQLINAAIERVFEQHQKQN